MIQLQDVGNTIKSLDMDIKKLDISGRDHSQWSIHASKMAKHTFNPIRRIVDGMELTPHPDKDMIALSIGDPTVFGNMNPCIEGENAVIKCIQDRNRNGYAPSIGYEDSRQAVADYLSTDQNKIHAKDMLLASGCSGAIDIAIAGLVNPGQTLLVPRPGFSLYKTLAESLGLSVYHYNLLPDKQWEVDLDQLDSLIDEYTALIVVNNPSNPCGSVYTKEHLKDIIDLCAKRKVPILADEVYAHFTFKGETYHSMASLSKEVPIFACGGLTKRFIVPGWRLGWIAIHDPCNNLGSDVRKGLVNLSQRILGPNTLIQGALKTILTQTPQAYFDDIVEIVQNNAEYFYDSICDVPGLKPIMPKGAMYIMVGIDMEKFPDFKNDVEFTEALVKEQSVFCLPAKCFQYPNYFRVVLTIPLEKLEVACDRIIEFCYAHYGIARKGSIFY